MTITAEQQEQARTAKANKAKAQRAEKAAALQALEVASTPLSESTDPKTLIIQGVEHTPKNLTITVVTKDGEKVQLTPEQKKRAATYTAGHGGLRANALATYILTGQNANAQTAAAKKAEKDAAKGAKERKNLSRSNDPEAAELAHKAAALAPDVRSAFLPKDAREMLDRFVVTKDGPKTITVKQGDVTQEFERAALESFAVGGDKNKDVRKQLAELAKDTRLWGRKLALMILVRAA